MIAGIPCFRTVFVAVVADFIIRLSRVLPLLGGCCLIDLRDFQSIRNLGFEIKQSMVYLAWPLYGLLVEASLTKMGTFSLFSCHSDIYNNQHLQHKGLTFISFPGIYNAFTVRIRNATHQSTEFNTNIASPLDRHR
jgi:hypothetical protein